MNSLQSIAPLSPVDGPIATTFCASVASMAMYSTQPVLPQIGE
jgi:hypothetical protein